MSSAREFTGLMLRPGDVVSDRYEIEGLLGKGGMGAVFAAKDIETGADVAMKCLLPELINDAHVVARFQREARATFRLKSRHVVQVLDTGVVGGDTPYIVMELLRGQDLKSLVRGLGPLSFAEATGFVMEACEAISEAHAIGIVHRDLKPANLFLAEQDDGPQIIKVLDFGIAKFTSPNVAGDHLEMTRTEAVLGSRAYMSPEQMLSPKDVDARADIWALGVILYFLVTGKNPFAADTTEGLILRVVSGKPQPLAVARPDLPDGFEDVVMRCLEKSRDHRWVNVVALMRALEPFLEGAPRSRPVQIRTAPPPAPSTRAEATTVDLGPVDSAPTSTGVTRLPILPPEELTESHQPTQVMVRPSPPPPPVSEASVSTRAGNRGRAWVGAIAFAAAAALVLAMTTQKRPPLTQEEAPKQAFAQESADPPSAAPINPSPPSIVNSVNENTLTAPTASPSVSFGTSLQTPQQSLSASAAKPAPAPPKARSSAAAKPPPAPPRPKASDSPW